MRDAYDALNRMLEQRERGEELDPSFEEFMEHFGDMFPGDPQDLDELLEQLAERMAAAQAVWNSLSPEQQAQLRQLRWPCSRTWTSAGRWTAWRRTSSGPSPTPVAAGPTTSTAKAR